MQQKVLGEIDLRALQKCGSCSCVDVGHFILPDGSFFPPIYGDGSFPHWRLDVSPPKKKV